MGNEPLVAADPTGPLRKYTHARIALGRSGASLPTKQWLDFRASHAAARDAVHIPFELEAVQRSIESLSCETIACKSRAMDRAAYLLRPDLGRRLDDQFRERLGQHALNSTTHDLAIVVCDGLSVSAIHDWAAPVLAELMPRLKRDGWRVAPVCVARFARVALQDEIGQLLNARIALTLIGERPGLAAANSMGAYLVFDPQPGKTDADRNCISNIHDGGLRCSAAADAIWRLLTESRKQQLSGIALKAPSSEQSTLPTASPD